MPPGGRRAAGGSYGGVCYDIGDEAALQRALGELQASSHRLVTAGAIVLAARLLNDQAAVYMRGGDLVRATYLLSQAHERFESHLRQHPHDAMALEELAGTEHLLARLPLHVQVPLDTRRTAMRAGWSTRGLPRLSISAWVSSAR